MLCFLSISCKASSCSASMRLSWAGLVRIPGKCGKSRLGFAKNTPWRTLRKIKAWNSKEQSKGGTRGGFKLRRSAHFLLSPLRPTKPTPLSRFTEGKTQMYNMYSCGGRKHQLILRRKAFRFLQQLFPTSSFVWVSNNPC